MLIVAIQIIDSNTLLKNCPKLTPLDNNEEISKLCYD